MSAMWPWKREMPAAVDQVWLTAAAKIEGIMTAAREAAAVGEGTLILAHFARTRAELEAALRSRAIEHQTLASLFDLDRLARGRSGSARVVVLLAMTDELASDSATQAAAPLGSGVRVLVAERYPLADRDRAVLSFAGASGVRTEVAFHSSLDDPLLTTFGAGHVTELVQRLGADERAPIRAPVVTSALQAAQKRVEKLAIADHRVDSAEEWFTYNMPR
jgi:preprotein translocase subunit SecA